MDQRHHRQQERQDWCVLACIDMVKASRRQPGIQQSPPPQNGFGFPVSLAADILRARNVLLQDDDPFLELRVALGNGHAIIVELFGPPYVKLAGTQPAGHASVFGDLCQPGAFGVPLHAVLVIAEDRNGQAFLVLDPYYPAVGQPVALPYDVFLEVMTLRAVIA